MGKRELVALLCLSSWCLVIAVWLFLTMPRVCLQFVIVVFPDHTNLLLFNLYYCSKLKMDVFNFTEVLCRGCFKWTRNDIKEIMCGKGKSMSSKKDILVSLFLFCSFGVFLLCMRNY